MADKNPPYSTAAGLGTSFDPTKTNKVKRTVNDHLLIEMNTDDIQIVTKDFVTLSPTAEYRANLNDRLTHFKKPIVDGAVIPSLATDNKIKFVSLQSIEGVDVHNAYLQTGPFRRGTDQPPLDQIFTIFLIKYGKAFVIPNYKTLEVLLFENQQTYRDILLAKPSDYKEFDLNFDGLYSSISNSGAETVSQKNPYEEYAARVLTSRVGEWNFAVRKGVEYKIKGRFRRDPGEYVIDQDSETGAAIYDETVFLDQTSDEKYRETYEGKLVIGAWIPKGDTYVSSIIANNTSATSGATDEERDIIALDDMTQTSRIMILGTWRKFAGMGFNYATLNEIDISSYVAGQGRYGPRGLFNLLVNADAMEIMAGGVTIKKDANGDSRYYNVANDGKIQNKAWSRFPHITYRNYGGGEYEDYFAATNGGNIFDNELLADYEPRGSIKYYQNGGSLYNSNELLQQMNQLDTDLGYIAPDWQALAQAVYEDVWSNRGEVANRDYNVTMPIPRAAVDRITDHKNQLQRMWHITNGAAWEVRNEDGKTRTHRNMFKAVNMARKKWWHLTHGEIESAWKSTSYQNFLYMKKSYQLGAFAIYYQWCPWTPVHLPDLDMNSPYAHYKASGTTGRLDYTKEHNGYGACFPYAPFIHNKIAPLTELEYDQMRAWISRYSIQSDWHPVASYVDSALAQSTLSEFYHNGSSNVMNIGNFDYGSGQSGFSSINYKAPPTLFDRDFTKLLEYMSIGVALDIPYITNTSIIGGGSTSQLTNESVPAFRMEELDIKAQALWSKFFKLLNDIDAWRGDADTRNASALYDASLITDAIAEFITRNDDLYEEWQEIDQEAASITASITNTSIGASSALELVDRLAAVYYSQFYKTVREYSKQLERADDGATGDRDWRIRFPQWVLNAIKANTTENLYGINKSDRYAGV